MHGFTPLCYAHVLFWHMVLALTACAVLVAWVVTVCSCGVMIDSCATASLVVTTHAVVAMWWIAVLAAACVG